MREARVCVVNASWPRVSTTFIAQEFVGLEKRGLRLWLATFGRSDTVTHSIHRQLQAPVRRLPEKPRRSLRFLSAWLKTRALPGYAKARALLREELARGPRKRALKSFARGVILAAEMPGDTRVVYSHFLDAPTSVALHAALIRGLPAAASSHARDIWLTDPAELGAKLALLRWCATCTEPGADYLRSLADRPDRVHLIYHGLDFGRFPDPPEDRPARNGSDPRNPVRLLSVGRAVEKKGFDVLLDAFAQLPQDLAWQWDHVGTGRILEELQARATALGLDDRIAWHGIRDQDFVIARYRDCDLFVLPSREAGDGDRDGLPNVLMEAQTQALPCLSTRFSAIPELIRDGETGVLVEPGDAAGLAGALERLIRAPDERIRLAAAGYARVREHFRAEAGIERLAALLRREMA